MCDGRAVAEARTEAAARLAVESWVAPTSPAKTGTTARGRPCASPRAVVAATAGVPAAGAERGRARSVTGRWSIGV
jgi:hypothetical protein